MAVVAIHIILGLGNDCWLGVTFTADLLELMQDASSFIKVKTHGFRLRNHAVDRLALVNDKVDEAEVELVQVQVDGALELAADIEGPLSGFHDLGLHSVECRTEQTFVNEESDRQLGLLLLRQ